MADRAETLDAPLPGHTWKLSGAGRGVNLHHGRGRLLKTLFSFANSNRQRSGAAEADVWRPIILAGTSENRGHTSCQGQPSISAARKMPSIGRSAEPAKRFL